MKPIIILFMSFAMVFMIPAQKLFIPKTIKPPVIDGVIDSRDPWMKDNWVEQSKPIFDNSNMKSKFQLMWDDDNLYFVVIVEDAIRFVNHPDFWHNDCVTLYIAMDTTTEEVCTFYETGDRALWLSAKNNADIYCIQGAPKSGKYICKDYGDKYIQEWLMPWDELIEGMQPSWDGRNLRIDVQTTDYNSETGPDQVRFWNDDSDIQWACTEFLAWVAIYDEDDPRKLQFIFADLLPEISCFCGDINMPATTNSGLPVILQSSNPAIATIINNKIHPVSPGKCIITATQTGNDEYKPAKAISRNLIVNSNECNPPKLHIYRTNNPPVIDGIIDSFDTWLPENWINIEKTVYPNNNYNLGIKFQLNYDDSSLYFAIQVNDSSFLQNGLTDINNDWVEVFIALDTATADSLIFDFVPGDNYFWLNASNGANIYKERNIEVSGIYKCIVNEDNYVQEWAIPWHELTKEMIIPWDKRYFLLEITVLDCDTNGEVKQSYFWNYAEYLNVAWYHIRRFGLVKLNDFYTAVQYNNENMANLYPVPAHNLLFIDGIDNVLKIEIFNIMGIKVLTTKNKEIDISGLVSGSYVIQIFTDKKIMVKKFIKN